MTVNLYWKNDAKFQNLVETPFASERELEAYIFDNQEILGGDISIIHRQIRTGSKQGIPDMLGVDQDANACIVELKNVEADEDILPQSLSYAIWAETNPDSIKAIWLESKHKPDDIELDWDNLDIRIILVAPSFKATVPRMVGKIGYRVDLIEVRRYVYEGNEFVLVENLETAPGPRAKTTKVLGDWDWDYYEEKHGAAATAQFRKAVGNVEAFAQRQGWSLPFNLNKDYTGFKLGNRVVIAIGWAGSKAWNIQLKLPEDFDHGFQGEFWEFQRYDSAFHNALYRTLNPDDPNIEELEPLLLAAYEYVSGRK